MKRLFIICIFISAYSFGQSVDGGLKTLIATGTANTYVISEALPATYNQKERFQIIFPVTNTGSSTINRNFLGVKDIRRNNGDALSANDLIAGSPYLIGYNSVGGYYVCETCGGGGGGGGAGDVVGPASSVNNNVVFFNGTTGKLIKDSGLTLSGSNTGDNAVNSLYSGLVSNATHTGDATGATALTLATVNSNVGSFGSGTQVGTFTVNGKGLITSASNTTITPAVGNITGLGTGVATWLATPSWSNFNSAITGTAPFWSLATGGTFTAPITLTGSSTNTLTFSFPSLGTTITRGAGLLIVNPTSAGAGSQQHSFLSLGAQGWKTNATAGSQSVIWDIQNLPVQGAANPTSSLIFSSEVNGAATNGKLTLNSNGARLVSSTDGLQIQTNGAGVGGLSFNGSSPVSGSILMTPGNFQITTGSSFNAAGNGIVLSNGSSINATSGEQNGVNLLGTFNPTSGTATHNILNIGTTINQTGGANGLVTGVRVRPLMTANSTFTGVLVDVQNPGNISGTNLAFHSTSGSTVFGHTSLSSTSNRMELRGVTTTTGYGLILRSSSGTDNFGFRDDGKMFHFITPANDNALTDIIVRDGATGELKYRTVASLPGGGGTYYAPTTLVANATDANFTATVNGVHNILDGVATVNRVITIPTGANGDVMKFYNTEDFYTWSFTGATVYLADRVTVQTTLLYNVPCFMEKIDGLWIITN